MAWVARKMVIVIGLRQVLSALTISHIHVMTTMVTFSGARVLRSVAMMMEHIPDHLIVLLMRRVCDASIGQTCEPQESFCLQTCTDTTPECAATGYECQGDTAYQVQMLRPSQVAVNQKSPVSVAMVLIA